ncbi:preprotein translocase subunit SECE1 [Amaranthus tricolor]|uniref:preprotein translocase subunit SECE1 n=1 Tax=Amaranthus tricolor TaxID=29722 RepID=UPI00258C8E81|nr:preprotein translocase subunit SECE1 [Amaranthus tricolor]
MAILPRSFHLSIPSIHPSPKISQSHLTQYLPSPPIKPTLKNHLLNLSKNSPFILKAAENGAQTDKDSENPIITDQKQTTEDDISELGAEIKKAMKEREKDEDSSNNGGFLSGVVEEIGQIEWPDFGKVVGTTGVVLGVIAGSSVVLLTVNAVLAELSDKVFAGKGVQDFFGG